MLPVAFEALSVRSPHSAKSANAKQDSGSSTPFTEMIDDVTTKADTSDPAATSSAAKDAADIQPRAIGQSFSTKSSSPLKSSAATLADSQGAFLSSAEDAEGETAEPGDQKGASKNAAGKIAAKSISVTSPASPAGKIKRDPSDDIATELPVDVADFVSTITNTDSQSEPTKQSGAGNTKAKDSKNFDGATMPDQAGEGAETVAAVTQPATAAVAALIDPVVTTVLPANQAAPQDVAATSTPSVTVGKAAAPSPSPDRVFDQSETEVQPVDARANPASSAPDLALADLNLEQALELPPALSAFGQVPAPPGKETEESPKLKAPLNPQPDASAEKPDNAVLSAEHGVIPRTQTVAPGPHAVETTEIDPQNKPPAQHESLPQDAPQAPKNSHALQPSTTLSLNGITIAAPVGAPHDAGPVGATASTPQSAPAALVPVSGIAVEIASKALTGKNRFEIRLDPPELGRIHVRLDIDRSGEISSHLVADRSDTLDLLRRDAPSLERALQDAGLKTSNNGLQFSLRDHGFARQEQPLPMPTNTRLIVSDEALTAETTPTAYRPIAGLRAGLDIRV